jgi:hypothetical protein
MIDVTVSLTDKLYERAKQWAAVTHQDLDEALVEALDLILAPLPSVPELDVPIATLSDAEVLAQTQLRLPDDRGRRLSDLSERRRAGPLPADEQQELFALTQTYQRYWLRQAEALAEAARRGLTPIRYSGLTTWSQQEI